MENGLQEVPKSYSNDTDINKTDLSDTEFSETADQRAALAHQRQELDQRQAELDKAEETIGLLSQYTLVSPEGEPPDYAALYPDFYAPDWEGETVSGGKRCYLTFDDGPSPNTDRILEVLDRYGVKATFFVVGYEARTAAGQERMRRIVAEGHALAMHSWSHDYKKVYASVEGFLEDFYNNSFLEKFWSARSE